MTTFIILIVLISLLLYGSIKIRNNRNKHKHHFVLDHFIGTRKFADYWVERCECGAKRNVKKYHDGGEWKQKV